MVIKTQHSYHQTYREYDVLKAHVTFWMNSLTATSVLLFLILLVWLLPGDYTYLLLFSPVPAIAGYGYYFARRDELVSYEVELREARFQRDVEKSTDLALRIHDVKEKFVKPLDKEGDSE